MDAREMKNQMMERSEDYQDKDKDKGTKILTKRVKIGTGANK